MLNRTDFLVTVDPFSFLRRLDTVAGAAGSVDAGEIGCDAALSPSCCCDESEESSSLIAMVVSAPGVDSLASRDSWEWALNSHVSCS